MPIEQKVGGLWGERPGVVTYKHIPALRMLRQEGFQVQGLHSEIQLQKKKKKQNFSKLVKDQKSREIKNITHRLLTVI